MFYSPTPTRPSWIIPQLYHFCLDLSAILSNECYWRSQIVNQLVHLFNFSDLSYTGSQGTWSLSLLIWGMTWCAVQYVGTLSNHTHTHTYLYTTNNLEMLICQQHVQIEGEQHRVNISQSKLFTQVGGVIQTSNNRNVTKMLTKCPAAG